MSASRFVLLGSLILMIGSRPSAADAAGAREAKSPQTASADPELLIGGVGGVYFLAEPGELTVEVVKRDRNRRQGRQTEMRLILAGPDRKVLQEAAIPDDGLPAGRVLGPPRRARLSVRVERKGVYALNVTVSQDRYGEDIVWGFRSNCSHYLIETSRGHRDARREEPLVLASPTSPGDVCFLPRKAAFGVEMSGLLPNREPPRMFDAKGALIQTLSVDPSGKASASIPAGISREATPWRLHLPSAQATIQIDGLTRWDQHDAFPNLPCWAPEPKSFFALLPYRWIVTPYSRTVYGRPGGSGEAVFQVDNNSDRPKTIRLALEFPEAAWSARLSADRVVLRAKEERDVALRYTVPSGPAAVCHLRATPVEDPDFSTYATLTVKPGASPAEQPLRMPLVLKPYQHENEQFGYLPNYPVAGEPYFDLANRPLVETGGKLAACSSGQWSMEPLRAEDASSSPRLSPLSSKIAVDRDGDVYLLASARSQPVLLHSSDHGKTFSACPIPARKDGPSSFDLEVFTGHNVPDGPPPILRYTRTAADPRLIWRRINDLELFLPKKTGGRITLGSPILVTRKSIGLSTHSGAPCEVVSRGDKVHVTWAEATEPGVKVPGVPTYVVTCDRTTGRLGTPALVGYGAPANDIHNSPSITIDSQGYLHVLAGTHGSPFQYARSLEPNDAGAGWTDAAPTGEGLRQTYIGLVCGPDDSLHLVFRYWRSGEEPFPKSLHATLAYQRKPKGGPWEPPQVLIVSPFSEYSVFYHRLTIDRIGRLFLSYDYWSTYWFYRTDHRGSRRALLTSPDGGTTWKLADNHDLSQ